MILNYAVLCRFLRRREQEIGSIVQSIEDLNTIFKDLALMVTEQVLNVVLYCRSFLATEQERN
jgi:t-SNARE complex subunit (syntaxin)